MLTSPSYLRWHHWYSPRASRDLPFELHPCGEFLISFPTEWCFAQFKSTDLGERARCLLVRMLVLGLWHCSRIISLANLANTGATCTKWLFGPMQTIAMTTTANWPSLHTCRWPLVARRRSAPFRHLPSRQTISLFKHCIPSLDRVTATLQILRSNSLLSGSLLIKFAHFSPTKKEEARAVCFFRLIQLPLLLSLSAKRENSNKSFGVFFFFFSVVDNKNQVKQLQAHARSS